MKNIKKMADIFNNYKIVIPEDALSESEVNRIHSLAMGKINGKENRRFPKKKFVTLLVASVLGCSVLFAGASALFHWDLGLELFFKPTDELKEKFGDAVLDINKSDKDQDLTVTVKQMIGDKTGGYVIFEVTTPNNLTENYNNGLYGFSGYKFSVINDNGVVEGVNYYYQAMADDNPNDNKKYFCISTGSSLKGCTVALYVSDLVFHDWNKKSPDTIAEGDCIITWTMDYTELPEKTYSMNKEIPMLKSSINLESITISPFYVTVTMNDNKKYEKEPQETDDNPYIIYSLKSFVLHFKNGETIAAKMPVLSSLLNDALLYENMRDNNKNIHTWGLLSTKIFDPDEVDYITINGVDIPLNN